jgi:hypothetical protein
MSSNSTLRRATRRYKGRTRLAMLGVLILGAGVSTLSGLGANDSSVQVGQQIEGATERNKAVVSEIDHGIEPASIPETTIQTDVVDTNQPVLHFDRIVEVSGDGSGAAMRLVL